MADEVTLEDIEEEQKAIALLSDELTNAETPEQIEQLTAMIAEMAAKLEAMCESFEDQVREEHPEAFDDDGELKEEKPPRVEVILTDSQRDRVREETGVDMPSVLIDDPDGTLTRTMEHSEPEEIEEIAVRKAIEFVAMSKAIEEAAKNRQEAEDAVPDEVKDMLAEMEEDEEEADEG